MDKLKQQLDTLLSSLENATEIQAALLRQNSVYPFNNIEHIIVHLIALNKLTLEEYEDMRTEYLSRNKYLYLFEISAPRGFGEVWAQKHLKDLVSTLQSPNKRSDSKYSGQYDFFLPPSIRIEVKASRAVEFQTDKPLYLKALSSNSSKPFDMNFQQIKPACCDVFVWIAVWRDVIKYWVIPSFEVENNLFYSKGQHRGNIGEGQLHLNQDNIYQFDKYLANPMNFEEAIISAFNKEIKSRNFSS
ncbi:MAG: hypothetical protein WCS37_08905 [Chloroflexota bacterium]